MSHPYGAVAEQLSLPLEVVRRHSADVDKSGRFPEVSVAALGAAGVLGLTVPFELGGRGQGLRPFCMAAEELARECASTAMVYVMHTSALAAISASKSLADRDAILREAAKGEHLSTLALSEKGSRAQSPDAKSPLESTIYLARTREAQVRPHSAFDGLGLRGNDSSPVSLENL